MLRVLHNLSFIDDPTRIFRGVRYEARHGFRFEDHTARLLRGCIEMGLVGDLSSSRLRDELVALLEEPGAAAGIRRLGELGADRAIHPHLRGDDEAAALFSRASELRDELAVDVPRWHIGLAALAREMPPDEAYDWLDRLTLRRRDAERIVGAVTVAPRIVERLRSEPLDAAQVVALADPFAPDAPLLALAIEDRPELREYFDRLRDVRLEISGADLIALGLPESPQIGRDPRRDPQAQAQRRARRSRGGARCCARARGCERACVTVASASEIAERYARVCEEVGPAVTVVVATKYVSAEEMGALAEAGVAVVGENRAQDLEEKHALYGDAFRWHFIGHLQSNKVKVVNRLCELVHSVGVGLGGTACRRFRRCWK